MTHREAVNKLGPLFADQDVRDAIITLLGELRDERRDRLSYAGGEGDFYRRAADLIEVSGGVIALEQAVNIFLMLRQEYVDSINSPSE